MDPKTRLMANAAYLGFFGIAGVTLMVYFAATTRDPWVRFVTAAASAYFAVVLVLAGMVVAHAWKRAADGFTLELRFRRKITLATVASMVAVSAAAFVGAVALDSDVIGEAIIGAVTGLLAVALVLGIRDYRRSFPRHRDA